MLNFSFGLLTIDFPCVAIVPQAHNYLPHDRRLYFPAMSAHWMLACRIGFVLIEKGNAVDTAFELRELARPRGVFCFMRQAQKFSGDVRWDLLDTLEHQFKPASH